VEKAMKYKVREVYAEMKVDLIPNSRRVIEEINDAEEEIVEVIQVTEYRIMFITKTDSSV
jgi:hypothetical protein